MPENDVFCFCNPAVLTIADTITIQLTMAVRQICHQQGRRNDT
jgi:hypothetical protein